MITVYHLGRQQHRFLLSPSPSTEERLFKRKPEGVSLYSAEPMAEFWHNMEMEMEELEPEELPPDWNIILSSSKLITLSEQGFDLYGELLSDYGEFLPAHYKDQPVHVFHCTNVVDCMDQEQTIYEIGHICGPVTNFRKIGFKEDLLESNMIFKDKPSRGSRLWITAGSNGSELLQMFLDNQTGVELQPVAVYPET